MDPSGSRPATVLDGPTRSEPAWATRLPRPVPVEWLVVVTFALLGFAGGSQPLSDNSAFVHLRTGIDMVRTGSIPRVDPYSFTAHGHPWVVQSWFASLLYGLTYRLGGIHLFVLLNAVLLAALGFVVALLARTGSGVRTMVSAGVAVGLGIFYWSPRPLVFGLLALALLITVVERSGNPLWLIPIVWIWVNTHGSFPLGLAWLGFRIAGEMIDTRTLRRPRWRLMGITLVAFGLSILNPLGIKLLVFPLSVGHKQAAFKHVIEWASPNFQTAGGGFTLVFLAFSVLVLTRARLAWADALPVTVFLALGLFSSRNLAPLAVVMAPALGRALRPALLNRSVDEPENAMPRARGLNRAAGIALAFLGVTFAAVSLTGPGLALTGYPTRAENWMETHGLFDVNRHRIVAQDVVGCYLILLHGRHGRVFVDDRVDMYPLRVSADYLGLLRAQPSSPEVLDRYSADVVLWQKDLGLVPLLRGRNDWVVGYEDKGWVVLTRVP